jgi:uncharacterized protein YjiS (DUF1127 family)
MTMIASHSLAARWPARTPKTDMLKGSGRRLSPPMLWLQRLFWRAELKSLDPEQLRDCGLDPDTVRREALKPFWRD